MEELVIDKKTNISKIKDKETITKLVLHRKVNPNELKDFINVKELTIKRYKYLTSLGGYNDNNEKNINKLPFKNNIEKLVFIDVANYGRCENINKGSYGLNLDNLKSIEFLGAFLHYNNQYLIKCESLESILFNIDDLWGKHRFMTYSNPLKEITIVMNNKSYKVNFDYSPYEFTLKTNSYNILEYANNNILSTVKVENDSIKVEHTLFYIKDEFLKDNIIYIPDYISCLSIKDVSLKNDFNTISFNLEILNNQTEKANFFNKSNLNKLKKIVLRTNKEMALFPNIEIDIEEELEYLYIEKNKLYIVFKNKYITIDKDGNKTIKEIVLKNESEKELDDISNIYKIDELEEYFYYKKLLELFKDNSDLELKNAMNIVGDRITKKLTRK